MNKPKILKSPLTLRQLENMADKDGRLTVNLRVDLGTLFDNDIESFNDLADEMILNHTVIGSLSDINYRVVGAENGAPNRGWCQGSVIIEVNADVSDITGDVD